MFQRLSNRLQRRRVTALVGVLAVGASLLVAGSHMATADAAPAIKWGCGKTTEPWYFVEPGASTATHHYIVDGVAKRCSPQQIQAARSAGTNGTTDNQGDGNSPKDLLPVNLSVARPNGCQKPRENNHTRYWNARENGPYFTCAPSQIDPSTITAAEERRANTGRDAAAYSPNRRTTTRDQIDAAAWHVFHHYTLNQVQAPVRNSSAACPNGYTRINANMFDATQVDFPNCGLVNWNTFVAGARKGTLDQIQQLDNRVTGAPIPAA